MPSRTCSSSQDFDSAVVLLGEDCEVMWLHALARSCVIQLLLRLEHFQADYACLHLPDRSCTIYLMCLSRVEEILYPNHAQPHPQQQTDCACIRIPPCASAGLETFYANLA